MKYCTWIVIWLLPLSAIADAVHDIQKAAEMVAQATVNLENVGDTRGRVQALSEISEAA